jgi:hypothetical protein
MIFELRSEPQKCSIWELFILKLLKDPGSLRVCAQKLSHRFSTKVNTVSIPKLYSLLNSFYNFLTDTFSLNFGPVVLNHHRLNRVVGLAGVVCVWICIFVPLPAKVKRLDLCFRAFDVFLEEFVELALAVIVNQLWNFLDRYRGCAHYLSRSLLSLLSIGMSHIFHNYVFWWLMVLLLKRLSNIKLFRLKLWNIIIKNHSWCVAVEAVIVIIRVFPFALLANPFRLNVHI